MAICWYDPVGPGGGLHLEDCQARSANTLLSDLQGQKVKQTLFQLKPDQWLWQQKGAKKDKSWLWITIALKGLMRTQGQANQNHINHS